MAKHIKGKAISKGQRISCKPLVKRPAIIVQQAERVATAMREAFCNVRIKNLSVAACQARADVVDSILHAAKANAGNNKVGRGWTANLSAQTVRKLVNEGVFA